MLISIDNSYQFRFLKSIHKRKTSKKDTINCVNQVINIYNSRGTNINQINADNEFECIQENVRPTNTVAVEEHVGIIERAIRTNKDDTRCHVHRLCFTHYPIAMVEGAQKHLMYRRNNLSAKIGLSKYLSPETLIVGTPAPDFNEIIKLNFGDYVQTYDGETDSSNKSTLHSNSQKYCVSRFRNKLRENNYRCGF